MVPSPVVEKKEPEKKGYNVVALLKSLSSEKLEVRKKAVRELRRLAEKGQNINTKELNTVKLLSDRVYSPYEDDDIRENALEALGYAARHGHIPYDEIAPFLGEVVNEAAEGNPFFRSLASSACDHLWAFIRSGYNPFRWNIVQRGVIEALGSPNLKLRNTVFMLVGTAVEKGQNIGRGVEKTLWAIAKGELHYWKISADEESDARNQAFNILLSYYMKRGDYKKIEELGGSIILEDLVPEKTTE